MSVGFGLDATTAAVSDRLIRLRFSEEELLGAMGADPAPIMATFERAAAQIEALRTNTA